MLEKHVIVGNRLELKSIRRISKNDEEQNKVYQSRIHDIISDDRIEITMPLEKTKLVLLPVGGEFELVFYAKNGLLQCFGKVVDRYKNNNIYILVIDIISNLKKHQRREYYRYSCTMNMMDRVLEPEEVLAFEQKKAFVATDETNSLFRESVIVDISGGGIRFVCEQEYEVSSMVLCKFTLPIIDKMKEFNIAAKVLFKRKAENPANMFEHRVQFTRVGNEEREEIIKFIFEEERKNRKREQS